MEIIEKQSGTAFLLKKGQQLKVLDPEGEQVSDMVLFNAEDTREKISSGKSLDFEESILLTQGNFLWSNRGRKMMEILEDTNGRNDFYWPLAVLKHFKLCTTIRNITRVVLRIYTPI